MRSRLITASLDLCIYLWSKTFTLCSLWTPDCTMGKTSPYVKYRGTDVSSITVPLMTHSARGVWVDFLSNECHAPRCALTCNRQSPVSKLVAIQGEHKRTLHFQSDTGDRCGVPETVSAVESAFRSQFHKLAPNRVRLCVTLMLADGGTPMMWSSHFRN
jgi:hypothetical protein